MARNMSYVKGSQRFCQSFSTLTHATLDPQPMATWAIRIPSLEAILTGHPAVPVCHITAARDSTALVLTGWGQLCTVSTDRARPFSPVRALGSQAYSRTRVRSLPQPGLGCLSMSHHVMVLCLITAPPTPKGGTRKRVKFLEALTSIRH